jgi:hypothetical protein
MGSVNINNKLIPLASLPLRPSAATRKYGHKRLPPEPIDRWLAANSHSPTVAFIQDYLLLKNAVTEHVVCVVERECIAVSCIYINTLNLIEFSQPQAPDDGTIFEDPPTYTLYITAHLPRGAKYYMLLWQSPRAVLEKFVGFSNDPDAPEWTRWVHSILEFQQPKASFADLFVRMAAWDENKVQVCCVTVHLTEKSEPLISQPGLPFRMAQWARSTLVDHIMCYIDLRTDFFFRLKQGH